MQLCYQAIYVLNEHFLQRFMGLFHAADVITQNHFYLIACFIEILSEI